MTYCIKVMFRPVFFPAFLLLQTVSPRIEYRQDRGIV